MISQHKQYLIICLSCFIIGVVFYAIHTELLIIKFAGRTALLMPDQTAKKQQVELLYLKEEKDAIWHTESLEIVMPNDQLSAVHILLTRLFEVLLEEKIIPKKLTIQDIMLDKSQELYISLHKYPFSRQSSTYQKWITVESILKTLKANNIPVQSVRFLVDHQPINDPHLDFSKGWPIDGFLSTK